MRIISRIALVCTLLIVAFAAPAAASHSCSADSDYCTPHTPNRGRVDSNDGESTGGEAGGAMPDDEERTPPAGNEVPTGEPGSSEAEEGETLPAGAGLPITGGDIVGLTVAGAVAIGLGAVAVRSSKRAKTSV